jgi:hypothetical protein
MSSNTIDGILNSSIPRHEKIGRLTALSDHYYRIHLDHNKNTPFSMKHLADKAEMSAIKLMSDANKEAREIAFNKSERQKEELGGGE